jgi:hypothetical protein
VNVTFGLFASWDTLKVLSSTTCIGSAAPSTSTWEDDVSFFTLFSADERLCIPLGVSLGSFSIA